MTCPLCGHEAYIGLTVIDCTNPECEHYTEKVDVTQGVQKAEMLTLGSEPVSYKVYISGNTITGADSIPDPDNGSPDPDTKSHIDWKDHYESVQNQNAELFKALMEARSELHTERAKFQAHTSHDVADQDDSDFRALKRLGGNSGSVCPSGRSLEDYFWNHRYC